MRDSEPQESTGLLLDDLSPIVGQSVWIDLNAPVDYLTDELAILYRYMILSSFDFYSHRGLYCRLSDQSGK
jgi:hypothetical protein